MNLSTPVAESQEMVQGIVRNPLWLSDFRGASPRFHASQTELLEWLAAAHARTGGASIEEMRTLMARFGASPDQIASRGHALEDFSHQDWPRMRLFGPAGSTVTEKTRFFQEAAGDAFDRLYPTALDTPDAIIHVTCTGYESPSAAQSWASRRGHGMGTQVIHAYHMGCYAAHPALRIAAGQLGFLASASPRVDIVHTELCSLHFDPMRHEPTQLVIQSLFADGFIRYAMTGQPPAGGASLELLGARDEIVPDSADLMSWTPGPVYFAMTLSKDVPVRFAAALGGFLERLLDQNGLSLKEEKDRAFFAIHPGGPRIIQLSEQLLALRPDQTAASRQILKAHGNMSSATLPHIWDRLVSDPGVPDNALIVSIGAGPGLTLSGAVFRKRL